ncbi:MAG: DUF3352 domain-containing protein [Cyanobacteria bacterium]|nr:DUF3352 domain-containing protein [Cyanobacteriota bacterium]
MKGRAFLAVLLTGILLLLSLAAAGWWLVWQRSPLRLQHQALALPRAARFVPRQAPFSLYLMTDAEEPVAYARALAPPRQRRASGDVLARLRDGAFAAAGLDYQGELASWLAPEIGMALLDPPTLSSGPGWLLALRSRDPDGARLFVQRFWQTRSLAGTDLQVTSYRGMGVISGRGALRGQVAMPLATALVDDDLLLIASGRGALEEALDVSQIDDLNQAAQPWFREGMARLGEGVALLVARPAAAGVGLLGPFLPEQNPAAGPPSHLVAALKPQGRTLRLEGLLAPQVLPSEPVAANALGENQAAAALLAGLDQEPSALLLLRQSAALQSLPALKPLLDRAMAFAVASGPLPGLVAEKAEGPLLLADLDGSWLLGTPADQPAAAALEAPLAALGWVEAPLEIRDHTASVWTRLEGAKIRPRRANEGPDQLVASVAGWRLQDQGLAWWGASIDQLREFGRGRPPSLRARQLQGLMAEQAPLQWALAARPARQLLRDWQPWRLLGMLGGGPLEGSVQGMALALEPQDGAMRVHGQLEFQAAGRPGRDDGRS